MLNDSSEGWTNAKDLKKKKELSRPKRHDHEVKTRIAKKMKPG